MIFSIALILISGLLFGTICSKLKLPSLIGMIAAGIIIGPYVLDLIDSSVLSISADIRKIALVVILIRAGLSLDIKTLKKVGRPALLMGFLPAAFETIGMIIIAPLLFDITILEAAIIGAVVSAVSPAVVVPKMIRLTEEKYGTAKGIPQMILAGASFDDVFVIVLFSSLTDIAKGGDFSIMSFVNIPISIITGIIAGYLIGILLSLLMTKVTIRPVVAAIIILCSALFLVSGEHIIIKLLPFASLIGVMVIGIAIRQNDSTRSSVLSGIFNKIWIPSEIFLFVLVGACVNIKTAGDFGIRVIPAVLGALIFRMIGVYVCVIATELSLKEKLFVMFAYTPKATVQAAIGGLALSMGLPCGDLVLTVAVIAIIITAPLGAFLIERTYKRLLCCS